MASNYAEITPGYGQPGIHVARTALVTRIQRVLTEALPYYLVVRARGRHDMECLMVQFDTAGQHAGQHFLQFDFWPAGPNYGFQPTWYYSKSQGGDLLKHQERIALGMNFDIERTVTRTIRTVQSILAELTLVPMP